jgi:hypothetical protein
LTLNTNKSAAGPACSSTPWLNHDSLGYYLRYLGKDLFGLWLRRSRVRAASVTNFR